MNKDEQTDSNSNILRQKVEFDRFESEARFRSIFDQSPVGTVIVGFDKRFVKSNQAFCNFIGYTETELVGLLITDITHPDDVEIGMKELTQLMHGEIESCKLRKRYVHKQGHVVWGEITISVVKDSSGQPLYFLPVIKDITRQHRAEKEKMIAQQALKKSESRARALINAIPDMIFMLNDNGVFLDFEAPRDELFYTSGPIIGKKCQDILPDDLAVLTLEKIKLTLETAEMQIYEYQLRIPQKGLCDFEARMVPVNDQEVISIVRNVTREKKTESEILEKNNQLRMANAEKDKFISIMAHDLKSPFNVFLGATELIQNEYDELSEGQVKSLIGSLHGSAKKLYQLLEHLLEWSRMQRGTIPFDPKFIQLDAFVAESLELSMEIARQKNINFQVSIPQHIVLNADSKMLDSLLRNLAGNAVKFTEPGGSVEVLASDDKNGNILISINDTGIGMPPEILNNLFSLTEKINRPGTEGEPSSGLGLLLCYEYAQTHGGEIRVESSEGAGSKFTVLLPKNIQFQ